MKMMTLLCLRCPGTSRCRCAEGTQMYLTQESCLGKGRGLGVIPILVAADAIEMDEITWVGIK